MTPSGDFFHFHLIFQREQFSIQHSVMEDLSLNLKHPSTFMICGPTQCGKSTFTRKLIINSDEIFGIKFEEIIYCLPNRQTFDSFDDRVIFMEGVPDLEVFRDNKARILILDDLMNQQNEDFVELFTRISHHNNVTVIYITQNLFNGRKGTRDMSLNAHYIVFFKNPRDKNQITYLARQVFPENPKYLQESYVDATKIPHGYLLIDLTQATNDNFRIRTNIFNGDLPKNIFYVPITYKKGQQHH